MSTRPPTQTAAAIAARRNTTAAMLDRLGDAITQMTNDNTTITVAGLARNAEVSRTFLYTNKQARALIHAANATGVHRPTGARAQAGPADNELQCTDIVEDTAWRDRALNAEAEVDAAYREIRQQRTAIAELLGRIRDLEADLPEDGVTQVLSENADLHKQVRDLSSDNKSLRGRLTAARDNSRFLDERVAGLEAQLGERFHPPISPN
ncbi:DUF6262 family protein [Nocardia sp. NPDC087230]|uniref:DUF6262 family protein n=1 Tax=Nocardia sp. NPDC087230 TaxID=3364331 RepID=UPI0038041A58